MVAKRGRGWKLAPCLVAMVDEADELAPNRQRKADGSIGDRAHSRRKSHHNPAGGYVDALDLTHSPAHGFDCHQRVAQMVAARDARIEYVIFDRQIWRAYGNSAWTGRPYSGSNPHRHHMHVSVWRDSRRMSTAAWWPQPTTTGTTADLEEDDDDMVELLKLAYAEANIDWRSVPGDISEWGFAILRKPTTEERLNGVNFVRSQLGLGVL